MFRLGERKEATLTGSRFYRVRVVWWCCCWLLRGVVECLFVSRVKMGLSVCGDLSWVWKMLSHSVGRCCFCKVHIDTLSVNGGIVSGRQSHHGYTKEFVWKDSSECIKVHQSYFRGFVKVGNGCAVTDAVIHNRIYTRNEYLRERWHLN